jgi:hypothetical protein
VQKIQERISEIGNRSGNPHPNSSTLLSSNINSEEFEKLKADFATQTV